jgi:hypothetical protein
MTGDRSEGWESQLATGSEAAKRDGTLYLAPVKLDTSIGSISVQEIHANIALNAGDVSSR